VAFFDAETTANVTDDCGGVRRSLFNDEGVDDVTPFLGWGAQRRRGSFRILGSVFPLALRQYCAEMALLEFSRDFASGDWPCQCLRPFTVAEKVGG